MKQLSNPMNSREVNRCGLRRKSLANNSSDGSSRKSLANNSSDGSRSRINHSSLTIWDGNYS